MAQHLAEYGRKRNFRQTPEPKGTKKAKQRDLFVVHKHHARRLHWDLRLQVGDVLASWAVPKQPTLDPDVKRLAVHVEDHPLEYADFKGTIPAGQYGAGLVEIWDKGTWRPKGDPAKDIKKGKLEFELFGKKLNGWFVLVRMHDGDDKNWLLKKMREEDQVGSDQPVGVPAAMPKSIKLQLCKAQAAPPKGDEWVHEVKWDGYRALAYVKNGEVSLVSRGGNPLNIPPLANALDSLPDCILDGEVVAIDPSGKTSFGLVHAAIAQGSTSKLVFYAFDVPYAEGRDLRNLVLLERKKVCKRLVDRVGLDNVRYSEHSEASGATLYKSACESGLEGIISKRANSKYGAGRTGAWIKCRCTSRLEGWIVGYTDHSATKNAVGALAIAIKDSKGGLHYVGKVGTGFSESARSELFAVLAPLGTRHLPLAESPKKQDARGIHWVEPGLKAEVEFLDWSTDGLMRQPSLIKTSMKAPPAKKSSSLPITHPDRIVDKGSGTTKLDVAEYYAKVADRMLQQVKERPLAIIRCPDGIQGSCFFQKHHMAGLDRSVKTVDVGEEKKYMYVDDAKGIMALVQFGLVELHTWGSHRRDIESPDFIVFDLDPGPDVSWKQVIAASHEVKALLEDFGLACWARVTGGKGVHVVSPIKPELNWETVKGFCKEVAQTIERSDPKRYVSTMSKAKRHGRIFIDYLRNGRGSTAIASYSLRARPGMTVAVPVSWDELAALKSPNSFTIDTIDRRLEEEDPWKGFARSRRSLKRLLP